MNEQPTYYELLGVEPDAGGDSLKRAYRRRAIEYHPDRNPGDSYAAERFKAAAEAYAVLSDPYLRTRYNCVLAGDVTVVDAGERARERERAFERNRELHVELNRLEMLGELYDESVRGAIRVEALALAASVIAAGLATYLTWFAEAWPDGRSHPAWWLIVLAWVASLVTAALLAAALIRHRSVAASRRLVREARTDTSHRLASATLKARFGS